MKVTKTNIHRLTIQKGCGCEALREYSDAAYKKPLSESKFVACEKHTQNEVVAEVISEMLIESLEQAAETASASPVFSGRKVAEGDQGGVVATGESVQAMGMNMPKIRERRDPLAPRTAAFDRPGARLPKNTNLNVALPEQISDEELEESEITITGDISDVPSDPSLEAKIEQNFQNIIDEDED